jgi:hypothetical protein
MFHNKSLFKNDLLYLYLYLHYDIIYFLFLCFVEYFLFLSLR